MAERSQILVVDDSLLERRVLTASLAGDYTVLEAADGEEAWDLLQTECAALVVTDLQMPHCTGIDLIHRIRADAHLAALPVILVTSSADPAALDEGLAAGATCALRKPCPPDELLARVADALAGTVPS